VNDGSISLNDKREGVAGFWIAIVDAEPAELSHLAVGTTYGGETARVTYGYSNSGRKEGTTAHTTTVQ